MKKTLTVALSLLSLAAFSQTNFKPGYIVLNSGDTVRGEINYRNWEKNPESIEFRTGEGNSTIYGIPDMRLFAIDNEDRYERAIVRRTTRPVDLELLACIPPIL